MNILIHPFLMKSSGERGDITLPRMASGSFFLTEGDFFLKLNCKNRVLNILSAPYVVGFIPAMENPLLYLERIDHGKILQFDYHDFWQLTFQHQLLDNVMLVLSSQYSDMMDFILIRKKPFSRVMRVIAEMKVIV